MRFSLPALASLAGLFAFATCATAAGIPEVCCISSPASASDPCSSSAATRSLPRAAAAGCSCYAPDLANCFVTCCAVGFARTTRRDEVGGFINTKQLKELNSVLVGIGNAKESDAFQRSRARSQEKGPVDTWKIIGIEIPREAAAFPESTALSCDLLNSWENG
ncbi:hypothetical protein K438DRAFT_2059444 [Mycena galopus ATCC 62051]|nr:hypothetical protein K438DRAFT_1774211 [Mycena galopus ATCC 62051]KAF8171003.1 hypothetical protein K438DRAFT_2059444 [Mycena galopus ATCC 62051]